MGRTLRQTQQWSCLYLSPMHHPTARPRWFGRAVGPRVRPWRGEGGSADSPIRQCARHAPGFMTWVCVRASERAPQRHSRLMPPVRAASKQPEHPGDRCTWPVPLRPIPARRRRGARSSGRPQRGSGDSHPVSARGQTRRESRPGDKPGSQFAICHPRTRRQGPLQARRAARRQRTPTPRACRVRHCRGTGRGLVAAACRASLGWQVQASLRAVVSPQLLHGRGW